MRLIQGVFALLFSSWVGAQTLPAEREPQFWDGDRLVSIEGPRMVAETSEGGRKVYFFGEGLSGPSRCDFFDGAYWVSHPMDREGEKGHGLLKSTDGKNRELEAWVPAKLMQGPVHGLYPLPKNRYLLQSKRLFIHGNKASFLGVGTKDSKGIVHFDHLIEMDLGEKALEGATQPGFLEDPVRLMYLVGFMVGRMRGGDHILFAHETHGRFLILDCKTLDTRFVTLFPDIDSKKYWSKDAFDLEHAVLGIQPRKNGHFLIASRSEDAVLKARGEEKAFKLDTIRADHPDPIRQKRQIRDAMNAKDRKDLLEVLQDGGAVRYPEVLWWDLDPEKGKLTKVSAPPGAPVEIHQAKLIRQFRFRFTPREELKFRD